MRDMYERNTCIARVCVKNDMDLLELRSSFNCDLISVESPAE